MTDLTALRIDCDDGPLRDTTTNDFQPLDDLAISGDMIKMARLERMDTGVFWGAIYLKDGRTVWLDFHVEKRTLKAGVRWE